MSPVEDGWEEDDLSHVCSGGPSVTHVPMQWEIAEERRILAVYAVEDAQWHMSPVGMVEEEDPSCVCSEGHSVTHVPSGRLGRRGGSVPCTQWGTLSQTCSQWEMGEERGSVPCMQRGTQWHMSPVEDGGEEDDLSHVCSGGPSVTHFPMQWGMGRERTISAMYTMGDAQWHMSPVGDGGGEEDLSHVCSGDCSVAHNPSGGWGRREGSQPCTQRWTLSDTCSQWGMGEERRISAMYTAVDSQWHMFPKGEERRISAMYTAVDSQWHIFPMGDGGGEEDLSHYVVGDAQWHMTVVGDGGRIGRSLAWTH